MTIIIIIIMIIVSVLSDVDTNAGAAPVKPETIETGETRGGGETRSYCEDQYWSAVGHHYGVSSGQYHPSVTTEQIQVSVTHT